MLKNFAVIILPNNDDSDALSIHKNAFFNEFEEAKEYMDKIIFEETGKNLSGYDRAKPIRVSLKESTIELWLCHLPDLI